MRFAVFAVLLVLTWFGRVHSLSCVPFCDKTKCPKLDCPGSEVPGLCGCCNRCAKQLGDVCGGDFTLDGVCEPNLICGNIDVEYRGDGPVIMIMPSRSGKCMMPDGDSCAEVCRLRRQTRPVGLSRYAQKAHMKGETKFGKDPYWVYCDCSEGLPDYAWMVVQRRSVNIESFDKRMSSYVSGFGFTNADYWIGLNRLNQMTENVPHQMRVIVKLKRGQKLITSFNEFSVGNYSSNYQLHVTASTGYSSKNFAKLYNGMAFTTKDKDNDNWIHGNCAQMYGGGWWFNKCTDHNLNGRLYKPNPSYLFDPLAPPLLVADGPDRISWESCKNRQIDSVEMWIRPTPPIIVYKK